MNFKDDIKKYLDRPVSKSMLELMEDILMNWEINPKAYAADPEEFIKEAFGEAQDAMQEGCCYHDDPHGDRDPSPEEQAGWAMQDKIDMYRAEY